MEGSEGQYQEASADIGQKIQNVRVKLQMRVILYHWQYVLVPSQMYSFQTWDVQFSTKIKNVK